MSQVKLIILRHKENWRYWRINFLNFISEVCVSDKAKPPYIARPYPWQIGHSGKNDFINIINARSLLLLLYLL